MACDNCSACAQISHPLGKARDSIYPEAIIPGYENEAAVRLSDIFKEGSEARRLFGKFYALAAILVILAALALLALATRGA